MRMKKSKKICDEILQRFGDGEYLAYICNGDDPYPDQSTFWRWRQKDADLAERFMLALVQNVQSMLERSELLLENAESRDEILRADKLCNHYRWKCEKLVPSMQSTSKSLVELQGSVGSYTVSWADDSVARNQRRNEAENNTRQSASLARKSLMN